MNLRIHISLRAGMMPELEIVYIYGVCLREMSAGATKM